MTGLAVLGVVAVAVCVVVSWRVEVARRRQDDARHPWGHRDAATAHHPSRWSAEVTIPLSRVSPGAVALLLGTSAQPGESTADVVQRVHDTLAAGPR